MERNETESTWLSESWDTLRGACPPHSRTCKSCLIWCREFDPPIMHAAELKTYTAIRSRVQTFAKSCFGSSGVWTVCNGRMRRGVDAGRSNLHIHLQLSTTVRLFSRFSSWMGHYALAAEKATHPNNGKYWPCNRIG
jgi:hypothetical protein